MERNTITLLQLLYDELTKDAQSGEETPTLAEKVQAQMNVCDDHFAYAVHNMAIYIAYLEDE